MTTGIDKPRGPEELAEVLQTRQPVFLVGGQAVNLWAMHYYERAVDLAPFVSRDIDLLGNLETLEELARIASSKPQIFPMRPPTNALGVVVARDKDGNPILIEVLRYVHGVTKDELRDPSYTFEIGDKRVPVCVPGPTSLLKAKIANLNDLNQSGRQDAKHVRILCRILPDYWKDLCEAVISSKLKERTLIDYLESVLSVIKSSKGKKVLNQLGIDGIRLFDGLPAESLPKVGQFVEKRLIH